jgi:hypothetical protein
MLSNGIGGSGSTCPPPRPLAALSDWNHRNVHLESKSMARKSIPKPTSPPKPPAPASSSACRVTHHQANARAITKSSCVRARSGSNRSRPNPDTQVLIALSSFTRSRVARERVAIRSRRCSNKTCKPISGSRCAGLPATQSRQRLPDGAAVDLRPEVDRGSAPGPGGMAEKVERPVSQVV